MKPKKIKKRLSLKKETIAHLKSDAMHAIKGGSGYSDCICSLDLCSEHPTCWVTKFCTRYCTVDDC